MSGAGELAMFLAIGATAVALLFGPIGSALARRIGGRPEPGDPHAEIEEIGSGLRPRWTTSETGWAKSRNG